MPIENEQQAAEALLGAIAEDRGENLDSPSVADNTENKQASAHAEQAGEQPTEDSPTIDSFTGLDPNALPDEVRPFYDSMLADYRRKTQEVAEQRKSFESLEEYGGVDAAREAVEFVTALSTDPTYALQVHEQLTEALTEAGLTPREAAAVASQQINEAVTQAPPAPEDDYDEFGTDPAIQRELSEIKTQLQQEREWREQQEEQQLQANLIAEIDRMHAQVQTSHPDWGDQDLDYVYRLAYSTGGDLIAAAEAYQGLRDGILGSYVTQKATVPTGVAPISGSGSAEQPQKFTDLNDPNLQRLAHERLEQMLHDAGE